MAAIIYFDLKRRFQGSLFLKAKEVGFAHLFLSNDFVVRGASERQGFCRERLQPRQSIVIEICHEGIGI